MRILAIDPGNIESAYVIMDDTDFHPVSFGKLGNEDMRSVIIMDAEGLKVNRVVIERVAHYGMAVGRDVFETCEWVGHFSELARIHGYPVDYIFRIEEKEAVCHDSKARDSNIRRALIDRFARHDLKNGKGTKKNPDFFYGFAKDCWAAFAVGYTYFEKRRQGLL